MMSSLRVRLLPVGQADCILLRFPDESWGVVDCGSSSHDTATFMALDYLARSEPQGMPLRFVVATHPDADHCLGIPGLLRHYTSNREIGAFYHCGAKRKICRGRAAMILDVVKTAEELRDAGRIALVKAVEAGESISWEPAIPGLSIYILNPPIGAVPLRPMRSEESNDLSVTLLITFGGVSVLLSGDIEGHAWARVVSHRRFRMPRILKVPHHGSLNGAPPAVVLDAGLDGVRWALMSSNSGVVDKPHLDLLRDLWGRPDWRTRCTGLSAHCDSANKEAYPVPADSRRYPDDLRQTLMFARRNSLFSQESTLYGCCVDNEISVDWSGAVSHSVARKGCDG